MAVHRFLAEKGLTVLGQGYNVIPIAPGGKFPTIPDFLTVITTPSIIKGWVSNGHANDGIGIPTVNTPVVDIDSRDAECSRHMQSFTEQVVGYGLVRTGQPPKIGILYRSVEPFRKMSSAVYIDSEGRRAQVEILGDGEQSVAFHIHPDTKRPYQWIGKETPENFPHDQLPIFLASYGPIIIAEFERYAESRGWERRTRTGTSVATRRPQAVEPDELLDISGDPLGLSDEEIRDRVMAITNDERFDERWDWNKIGMAIAHETGKSDFGREVWYDWSVQHPSHDEALFEKAWKSFEKYNDARDPITFRYIIALTPEYTAKKNVELAKDIIQRFLAAQSVEDLKEIAAEAKKTQFLAFDFAAIVNALKVAYRRITGNPMGATEAKAAVRFDPGELGTPEWLNGWCYLTAIDRFFSTETKQMLQRIAFDSAFSRCMPPDSLSTASHFALSKAFIEVYDNAVYMPAEDEAFKLNGRLCVNKYSNALVPDIPDVLSNRDRRNVERVKNHFSHLFADERDIRMCLSWLAHIVQTKQRPSWALIIQGVEGDGKTFIGELMAAVLGGDNVRMMAAQTLEAPHNAWAEGQLLTFIEEIRLVGHNRYDVLNKIKPLISNDTIEIHPKNINPYNVPNTTAYIASTNFVNALPLTANDRRYYVLMSQWQDADRLKAFLADHPAYYKDLFDAKDNSPGALRAWLESYELHPEFSARGRAPYSQGREYMTAMSKPERTTDIEEIIATGVHADVCADLLIVSSLNNILGDDDGQTLSGPSLRITLQEMGYTYLGRIKIDGHPQAVWTKNVRKWSRDPLDRNLQIRKYLDDAL